MSEASHTRWSDEDLALLRTLGGRMSEIIHGEDLEVPDLQRRDELGILVNMVSRLARELRARRRQDSERHLELTRRVEELQSAYETQEKLLAAIRSLPSPILELHEGLLLVPIAGAIDATRIGYVLPGLLERIAALRPEVVLVHSSGGEPLSPEVVALLLRAGQSIRHAGARPILCGVALPHPASLALLTPCETLQEALIAGLDHIGYRITR